MEEKNEETTEKNKLIPESNATTTEQVDESDLIPETNENKTEQRLFDPPLYKQRYHAITNVINQVQATRVVDMGCSEGQFLPVVKSMCPGVQEICGIDIDRSLLERTKFRLQPLTLEYVLKREKPLTMTLMHGSITKPDPNFCDVDFVACIEVIEHLYEEDLKQVPEALFGGLRPKTVAITTPNSEYNVLFEDFSGMRHWDHKFEWTRQEFRDWCTAIETRFPYTAEYSGIGEPQPEHANVGCCSQMAVFTRNEETVAYPDRTMNTERCFTYELIETVIYPFDETDRKGKILNEFRYLINRFYSDEGDEVDDEFFRNIPLCELLEYPGLVKLNVTVTEAVETLKDSDLTVAEDLESIVIDFKQSDFQKLWVESSDDSAGDEEGCHGNTSSEHLVNNDTTNVVVEPEEEWDI